MVSEPHIIDIDPDSDLARALAKSEQAVRLSVGGMVYRVSRDEEDIWAGFDPEKIRVGLRHFAGMLTLDEGERLKSLINRGREEGTRSIDRR